MKLELTDVEVKLLLKVLDDYDDILSDRSCDDFFIEDELPEFDSNERKELLKIIAPVINKQRELDSCDWKIGDNWHNAFSSDLPTYFKLKLKETK